MFVIVQDTSGGFCQAYANMAYETRQEATDVLLTLPTGKGWRIVKMARWECKMHGLIR